MCTIIKKFVLLEKKLLLNIRTVAAIFRKFLVEVIEDAFMKVATPVNQYAST